MDYPGGRSFIRDTFRIAGGPVASLYFNLDRHSVLRGHLIMFSAVAEITGLTAR